MGAKERRERIKQATRQGILDGARQIAKQEGWAALTIRKLAEHIEYSPSIVYEYFASKDEILLALLHEGFRGLAEAMRRAQQSASDAQQQVLRISEAYWQFARDNPDLYQVMHGLGGVALDNTARAEAVLEVCAIAEETLLAWAAANDVRLADPFGHVEIVWGLLHGLVSITLMDRAVVEEGRSKQLLSNAMLALLQGWRSPAPSS
jgi:AcrR family transcriptional regulator